MQMELNTSKETFNRSRLHLRDLKQLTIRAQMVVAEGRPNYKVKLILPLDTKKMLFTLLKPAVLII